MPIPLRLVLVEDSEDDALLVERELRRGGFDPAVSRVETLDRLREVLGEGAWDAVLADFRLPGFTGLDALRAVQAAGLDVPFLLISGVIGEETAVEAMKAGVHDYLRKGDYARLVPALERELRDAGVRRERRRAEAELTQYREHLEELVRERTAELAKANAALAQDIRERMAAEAALREAVADKEALIREVHHRVKNNLQMLGDLLFLQSETLQGDEARLALTEAQGRVFAIAWLHEQLYQSLQSGQVVLREYLERLLRVVDKLGGGVAVSLEVAGEVVALDLDRAIHTGLIVNELVTNAVKHAFAPDMPGRICVRLRTSRDFIELQVRDNGKGLAPGADPGKSLGLRLVHILARRLEAVVESESGPGTCFTIRFPCQLDPPSEPHGAR
jgi:two-component sensor histidine kinase/ActR/RegA family two-component response regulator